MVFILDRMFREIKIHWSGWVTVQTVFNKKE